MQLRLTDLRMSASEPCRNMESPADPHKNLVGWFNGFHKWGYPQMDGWGKPHETMDDD